MILSSARLALFDLPSPPFRAVLWKSLGLTAAVLVALWFGVEAGLSAVLLPLFADLFPALPDWATGAGTVAGWLGGLVLAFGLAFLIGPISAVIAGLFLDDVASVVERTHYPSVREGRSMAFWNGLATSVQFFGIVLVGNIVAFALLLVPGINLAAFFLVNGYLLGREYFEFAALRYRSPSEAKAMRRRHRGTVLLAGFAVAAFLSVPILNLLTPLFAAALMVHLHQRAAANEGGLPLPVTERGSPVGVTVQRAVPARHSS